MEKIKVAVLGYGNLGKGTECAIKQNDDMELAAVFTRRDPDKIKILTSGVPVLSADLLDGSDGRPDFDVLIACGGSASDLPVQTPHYAGKYNIVDSYDNHHRIAEHIAETDKAARAGGKIAVVSAGWDPGIFSLMRAFAAACMPSGADYTFWGKGVSQGHSDAVRRIEGVTDARQYTIPVESAVKAARSGMRPVLTTGEKHRRECFVLAEDGADRERITRQIITMPDYFDEYETTVHFITQEEMKEGHSSLPHGGMVIRTAGNGWDEEHNATLELKLKMDSNPAFCGGILAAYARAAFRLNRQGCSGCRTVPDIPVSYLLAGSRDELIKMI